MKTYLFVWNPLWWEWGKFKVNFEELYEKGRSVEDWSCGSTKSIPIGASFFMIKVGTDINKERNAIKGIIGSGIVVREPYLKIGVKDPDKEVLHVDLQFEVILNPYEESILPLDGLQTRTLSQQRWTPQGSGIEIRPSILDELETLWFNLLKSKKEHNPFLPNNKQELFREGLPSQVTQTVYERNPYARRACIDKYGHNCKVCNFNFEKAFGELGKDFIHVHHLKPISEIGKEYEVDPVKDLRPVCPNCHAMLHKKHGGITIEFLKSLLKQHSS